MNRNKSVLAQVRLAFAKENRLAATVGCALGGVIPIMTFFVDRFELDTKTALWQQIPTLLILGGLIFSATQVFGWTKNAFSSGFKAIGFVIIAEGVMVCSKSLALAVLALVFLVSINGVATACNLVHEWRDHATAVRAANKAKVKK